MTNWAALPDAERIRLLEAEIINLHVSAETRQRMHEEQASKIHDLHFENVHLREALLQYAHGEMTPGIAKAALAEEWKGKRKYQ